MTPDDESKVDAQLAELVGRRTDDGMQGDETLSGYVSRSVQWLWDAFAEAEVGVEVQADGTLQVVLFPLFDEGVDKVLRYPFDLFNDPNMDEGWALAVNRGEYPDEFADLTGAKRLRDRLSEWIKAQEEYQAEQVE